MHDHMHVQRPDFTYVGSARTLGLDSKHETAPNSHRYVIRETTLGALAADFQKRLGAKALRVVGDPNAKVQPRATRRRLRHADDQPADVDVIVSGEQQESGRRVRQSGLRARRDDARHREGLDHARSHPVGRSRACSKWPAGSNRSCRRFRWNS